MATLSLVKMCSAIFTLPNVPFPSDLPVTWQAMVINLIDFSTIRLTNYIVAQFGSSWMLVGLFLPVSSASGLTSLSIR